MPASRIKRTIYMSDNAKEKLLSLDPDASFSILVNRAVKYYYEQKYLQAYKSRKLWEEEIDENLTRKSQTKRDEELYSKLLDE